MGGELLKIMKETMIGSAVAAREGITGTISEMKTVDRERDIAATTKDIRRTEGNRATDTIKATVMEITEGSVVDTEAQRGDMVFILLVFAIYNTKKKIDLSLFANLWLFC